MPEISLEFDLDPQRTRVKATLSVERNGAHERALRLDGGELTLRSVRVDGSEAGWSMDGPELVVEIAGDRATVETEVEIHP